MRAYRNEDNEPGQYFSPEVKNVIRLTLAFAKAVGAHQEDPQDNLVVSPYNHLRFLSMLAKGAEGDTKKEMAQILFGVGPDELDGEIAKLITLNQTILDANKDKVTLKTATAFWANSDLVTLKQKFASELEQLFEARITSDSFANPNLVGDINNWASDSTKADPTDKQGLITHIVDKLDTDMVAFLASALLFRGFWTSKFDDKLTKDKEFTSDGGTVSKTPTMHQNFKEGDVTYQAGGDYEAVALTFGEKDPRQGKYPSMRIVLVRPDDPAQSARDWLAAQANGKVPAWLDPYEYEKAKGTVELPRIEMKQKHDLIPPLRDQGLQNTLSPAVNFNAMVEQGGQMEVSFIKEDIVFEADELGAKAASIVSGGIRATSVQRPPRQIDVKLDRSFVLAVQDVETGAVLFAGAVNRPNKDMKPVTPVPSVSGPS